MEKLVELYREWCGKEPVVERLQGSGSNRQYFRLTNNEWQSVIGVVGTNKDENEAFLHLTKHFASCQLPVPTILAVSSDHIRYLQTDLGNTSLYDAIASGRKGGGQYTTEEHQLLAETIRQLPNMQMHGAKGLDFSYCYPQEEFNEESVFFDLNYFKYCFLKATGLEFNEVELEADFRKFAKDLTEEKCDSFMYRDFQARNVMLDDEGKPHFIDYQGGRRGPFYYDVASFLWQASAKYPHKLRRELVKEYYEALGDYIEQPTKRHFVNRLCLFVLFRTLQVLGAYGFRGYFEKKKYFIDSIPAAIQNLHELLKLDCFHYPYMMEVLRQLTELACFSQVEQVAMLSKYDGKGPLVVRIFSFSYKKGIPEDGSGNGGGYVFDCRSTHNPGRYEPYKNLTGLDEPVIRFLEDDGEILAFLESIYKLADAHVARYIERGFTSLMFSFGCTGGQHRSVYSAQHLAEHIHEKFGIEVRICHREQGIEKVLL
ncbi:MAG: phosphotransferase [Prevotella sp.]|nr:phosphotransferase [Prevotella sp.]